MELYNPYASSSKPSFRTRSVRWGFAISGCDPIEIKESKMGSFFARWLGVIAVFIAGISVAAPRAHAGFWTSAGWSAGNHDHFGSAVALDGDWLVVGAPGDDSDKGTVTFFRKAYDPWKKDYFWSQRARFTTDGNCSGFYGALGTSVEMDGDYAVAGAPGCNGDRGLVYVYRKKDGTWTQSNVLHDTTAPYYDQRFGSSLSLAGDYLVVGAPAYSIKVGMWSQPHVGHALLYHDNWKSAGAASPCIQLSPDISAPNHEFGHAVAVTDGSEHWMHAENVWVIVGAPGYTVDGRARQGAAFMYRVDPNTCAFERRKLTSGYLDDGIEGRAGDAFGSAVGIQLTQTYCVPRLVTIAAVGAPGVDVSYPYSGGDEGYVYGFSGAYDAFPHETIRGLGLLGWHAFGPANARVGESLSLRGRVLLVGKARWGSISGVAEAFILSHFPIMDPVFNTYHGDVYGFQEYWSDNATDMVYPAPMGSTQDDRFGSVVALNRDGSGDMVIGAPYNTFGFYSYTRWDAGRVWTQFDEAPYVP